MYRVPRICPALCIFMAFDSNFIAREAEAQAGKVTSPGSPTYSLLKVEFEPKSAKIQSPYSFSAALEAIVNSRCVDGRKDAL